VAENVRCLRVTFLSGTIFENNIIFEDAVRVAIEQVMKAQREDWRYITLLFF
jgi:hypothetical protein